MQSGVQKTNRLNNFTNQLSLDSSHSRLRSSFAIARDGGKAVAADRGSEGGEPRGVEGLRFVDGEHTMKRAEQRRNLKDVHGCALDGSDEARGERGVEEAEEREPGEGTAGEPIEEASQPQRARAAARRRAASRARLLRSIRPSA